MGTFILVILGILFYVFLARIVFNIIPNFYKVKYFVKEKNGYYDWFSGRGWEPINEKTPESDVSRDYRMNSERFQMSLFFPFVVLFFGIKSVVEFIIKFPINAADYISDPSKYNFKIKIERSK